MNKIKHILKESLINLKSNLLLLISAIAFIILHLQSKSLLFAQIISFILILLTFARISNLFDKTQNTKKFFKILAFISTIGIIYYIRSLFLNEVTNFHTIISVIQNYNLNYTMIFEKLSYILMIFSSFIIYTSITLLFNYLHQKYIDIFSDISKLEKITYLIFTFIIIAFVSFVFVKTDAFYSESTPMDTIFTSDSGVLVNSNAYMRIYHLENDIRQPLLAIFAMPFIGIGYTLSLMFPFFTFSQPLFINYIQIILLIFSNFVLAKLLKLKPNVRLLFVILSMCTYMNLLFLFTMEQYIIAYFWLITLIYSICNKKQDSFILSGAGGTLITSLFLTLYIPQDFSIKKLKEYILNLIKSGLSFLYFLFLFGRLDIFFLKTILFKKDIIGGFVDKEITLIDKLNQYTEFIKNCFIKPEIVITASQFSSTSFQLDKIISINFIGIILFIIAFIGFWVSKKEKISQISFSWITFSFFLLAIIGWGAVENGMILYSLYFGWAFLILIYQFIKSICNKLKYKYLLEILTIFLIIILLSFNIPALQELLNFTFTYFAIK